MRGVRKGTSWVNATGSRRRRPTRPVLVLVAVLALLIASSVGHAGRSRWRDEVRSYLGFGYLNLVVLGPGNNIDCTKGISCVEVPLRSGDHWAEFEVADATGQVVGGWALGWTARYKWKVLDEFCGGSESPLYVPDQDKFVVVLAAGPTCAPDGVAPTTGEVSIRIGPKGSVRAD